MPTNLFDPIDWLLKNTDYGIPVLLYIFSVASCYFMSMRITSDRLFLDGDLKRIGVDLSFIAISFFLVNRFADSAPVGQTIAIFIILLIGYLFLLYQFNQIRGEILLVGPFDSGFGSTIHLRWKLYFRWLLVQFLGVYFLIKVLSQ